MNVKTFKAAKRTLSSKPDECRVSCYRKTVTYFSSFPRTQKKTFIHLNFHLDCVPKHEPTSCVFIYSIPCQKVLFFLAKVFLRVIQFFLIFYVSWLKFITLRWRNSFGTQKKLDIFDFHVDVHKSLSRENFNQSREMKLVFSDILGSCFESLETSHKFIRLQVIFF